jgi:hypothetical protein
MSPVGEYLAYPAQLDQPRHGRGKAVLAALLTAAVCVGVAGAARTEAEPRPGVAVAGVADLPPPPPTSSWRPSPVTTEGLRVTAAAGNGTFRLHTAGGDRTFLPGVNVPSTTPGHQPGELAITAEEYRGWFAAMSWLGFRVIRTYTIHPPAFYTELAAFNRIHPDRPLWLLHGVYLPDESYLEKGDLYDVGVTNGFDAELRDASGAVSGTLSRPAARGRASGTWTEDVSAWLAGWVVGVEWDPTATDASDRANATRPVHRGRYFTATDDATPTERWLAARLDRLAGAEAAKGRSTPIAFVNWPTTDPLAHPDEPSSTEDLVTIDANRVVPTAAWPGGTFASYHLYPYYPDFQRHEPALQRHGYAGRPDPYAGYLAALRGHHGSVPVMVTEFGVPSSLGNAHDGPLGRSQGNHSEQQAMRIDAELLRLIHDSGAAGALLFNWTDEWFKFTWNTLNHQDPERRQLWHDALTNEQHFGIVATDPLGPPGEGPRTLVDSPGARPVHRATAELDEGYVHLRLSLGDPAPPAVTVAFDVLPDLTGAPAPGTADTRADAAFTFDLDDRTGRAYLRAELDPMPLDYPVPDAARHPAPTGWRAFQQIVNRELTVPTTGRRLGVELFDAGNLRYGSWDPADEGSDSRALWRRDGEDLVVRVPWAMAGYADPSDHRVHLPKAVPGERFAQLATVTSPGIEVSVAAGGATQRLGPVRWDRWQRVNYRNRLKQGARVYRDALYDLLR